MATKKPAAKPAAKKPAPKSSPAKSGKSAAPAKKATPVKKAVAVKKAVPAKKPVPAKKAAPAKKTIQKTATKKPAAKVTSKKPVKVVSKKPIAHVSPKKSSAKPVAKKVAPKPVSKAAVKTVVKKAAPAKKVVAKAPVKPVPKPQVKTPAPPAKPEAVAKAPVKVAPKPAPAKPTVPKPVVVPKLNTKTARKYEPDFTKSVLDSAPPDPGAPIVMYSDADLAEFRELIQRKLGSAKKEVAYLQGLITRKDDMGGDEGDNRYMTMEDGSLSMEREQLSQMASRQITFIDHLEKALMRIENKTYGVCRVTGKLIDKARLRAVPHATLSIEAKMINSK